MTIATATQSALLAAVARAHEVLDDTGDLQPIYLSEPEKETLLLQLAGLAARVDELRLRALADAGDVAVVHGARDAAGWLAHAAHADPAATRADLRLAEALHDKPVLTAGMRAGAVNTAQARVIAKAVDDLPDRLGPTLAADAESRLVEYAAEFGPIELRRLGRRILDVLAPEIADEEDARRLEAEEANAREKAAIRFRDLGDGQSRFAGVLPTAVVERWKTYLDAYSNPQRMHLDGGNDSGDSAEANPDLAATPFHRRRAWAFMDLLELLDPQRLPEHGGDATSVVVTITLDQLRADLAAAGLLAGDNAGDLSASEARRLACQAKIIPAVLYGKGRVLDLGRAARLFQPAQRIAARLRDKTCRAEGCAIPARWCHLHHEDPWSTGGATDLDKAITLCGHHHRRIHDHAYTHQRLPDGSLRFHRRT